MEMQNHNGLFYLSVLNSLSITTECFERVAASISHAAVCVATALGMQASEEAVKELKEESGESTIAEELQEAPQNAGDGVLFLFCSDFCVATLSVSLHYQIGLGVLAQAKASSLQGQ